MQDRAASPMQAMPRRPMPDRPVAPLPDRPGRPIPDRPGRPDRPVPPIPDRPGRPDRPVPRFLTDPDAPFPTGRDGLTGPFLPDLFLPGPFLPGPFRLYAPTGPGTGVQSCPASFFRSPCPRQILQCICPGTDSDLREQPPGGVQSELFAVLPYIQCDSRTLPHYGLPGKRYALASGRYLDELPAESGLYSCPDSFRFQFPASDILVLTY